MKDVSIIIVSYNTSELTLQCVKSIYAFTKGVSFEVIVVDNASSDNTVCQLREQCPAVIVVENDENLGFGRANNKGSEIAQGKYLLFLNSDTYLLDNAIKAFFDFAERNTSDLHIGCLGGILLDKEKNIGNSGSCFPNSNILWLKCLAIHHTEKDYQMKKIKRSIANEYAQIDYVIGADMFIKKETFQAVKGFDHDFFMYFEESDLQKRLVDLGYVNYIISRVKIVHLEGASMNVTNKKRIMVAQSMFKYMRKHQSFLCFHIFKFIYICLELLKTIRLKYSVKENLEYIKEIIKS